MANQKQTHMSVEEYKAYLERQNSKSTNKYKNTTLWYDGLYFQSQKELDDYLDQKRLLMAGEIAGFLWQGVLVLADIFCSSVFPPLWKCNRLLRGLS